MAVEQTAGQRGGGKRAAWCTRPSSARANPGWAPLAGPGSPACRALSRAHNAHWLSCCTSSMSGGDVASWTAPSLRNHPPDPPCPPPLATRSWCFAPPPAGAFPSPPRPRPPVRRGSPGMTGIPSVKCCDLKNSCTIWLDRSWLQSQICKPHGKGHRRQGQKNRNERGRRARGKGMQRSEREVRVGPRLVQRLACLNSGECPTPQAHEPVSTLPCHAQPIDQKRAPGAPMLKLPWEFGQTSGLRSCPPCWPTHPLIALLHKAKPPQPARPLVWFTTRLASALPRAPPLRTHRSSSRPRCSPCRTGPCRTD